MKEVKEQKSKFQEMEFVNCGSGGIKINHKSIESGERFIPDKLSLQEIYNLYRQKMIMPVEQAQKIAAAKAESERVMSELEKDLSEELAFINAEAERQIAEAAAANE